MSQSHLLFGNNCIKNVALVSTALKSNKIKEFNSSYPGSIEKYHPLLFSRENYTQITDSDWSLIKEISVDNFNDRELLRFKKLKFNDLNFNEKIFYEVKNINMSWSNDELSVLEDFCKARELLKKCCRWIYDIECKIVDDIWPVKEGFNARFLGGCCSEYQLLGLIFISIRPLSNFAVEDLAIAYAHEIGHQVVMTYQAGMLPISKKDWDLEVYSGIKQMDRPVYLSFHGAVALGYMLHVTKVLKRNEASSSELYKHLQAKQEHYESSLRSSLEALKVVKLTKLGEVIIFELNQELAGIESL